MRTSILAIIFIGLVSCNTARHLQSDTEFSNVISASTADCTALSIDTTYSVDDKTVRTRITFQPADGFWCDTPMAVGKLTNQSPRVLISSDGVVSITGVVPTEISQSIADIRENHSGKTDVICHTTTQADTESSGQTKISEEKRSNANGFQWGMTLAFAIVIIVGAAVIYIRLKHFF